MNRPLDLAQGPGARKPPALRGSGDVIAFLLYRLLQHGKICAVSVPVRPSAMALKSSIGILRMGTKLPPVERSAHNAWRPGEVIRQLKTAQAMLWRRPRPLLDIRDWVLNVRDWLGAESLNAESLGDGVARH